MKSARRKRRSDRTLTPERIGLRGKEFYFWLTALAVYSLGHDITRETVRRYRDELRPFQHRCWQCHKWVTSICLDCTYRNGGPITDADEPHEYDLYDRFNRRNQ
jgi:hypothetical protein